jgi:pSer/pThr/pTyr-binding forkhead associated (FHA) protein
MIPGMSSARDAAAIARRIRRSEGLVPEQIISPSDSDTGAVLLDQWGRAHLLSSVTVLGREAGDARIAVLSSSVSRRHAELRLELATSTWYLRDLGSTNGTFLEGGRVDAPVAIADEKLLAVGDVVFAFIAEGGSIEEAVLTDSMRATAASPGGDAEHGWLRLAAAEGGGGLAEYAGRSVQLGSTQLALLELLVARYLAEQALPGEVRGFVRTIELLTVLPWDTAHPTDNHVKQLVRRVRRALARLGLDESIESRHGFGYRLPLAVVVAGA